MFKIGQAHSPNSSSSAASAAANSSTTTRQQFGSSRLMSDDDLFDVLDSKKRQSTMSKFGTFGGGARKQLMFFSREETENQDRLKKQKQMPNNQPTTTTTTTTTTNSTSPTKSINCNDISRRKFNSLFDSDMFLGDISDDEEEVVRVNVNPQNYNKNYQVVSPAKLMSKPAPPHQQQTIKLLPISPLKPIMPLKPTTTKPLPLLKPLPLSLKSSASSNTNNQQKQSIAYEENTLSFNVSPSKQKNQTQQQPNNFEQVNDNRPPSPQIEFTFNFDEDDSNVNVPPTVNQHKVDPAVINLPPIFKINESNSTTSTTHYDDKFEFNILTMKPKDGYVNRVNSNNNSNSSHKQIENTDINPFSDDSSNLSMFTRSSILQSLCPTSTASTASTSNQTYVNNNISLNDQFDALENVYRKKGGPSSTASNGSTATLQKSTFSSEEIRLKVPHEVFRNVALMLKDYIVDISCSDSYAPALLPLPCDMNTQLSLALQKMGYTQLYSHQLECRQHVLSGHDTIITTPTSSGKSLCLFIPIFEEILNQKLRGQRSSTALFLFPLNALANNQIKSINHLNTHLEAKYRLKIKCINGDTDKNSIPDLFHELNPPDIVMTNPDWLHYQLQRGGHHERWRGWRNWFAKLKFIVLDEAHTYSGVMGCHFINLLRRIANYHRVIAGGDNRQQLQYILASATVGNPKQMTMKMVSRHDESNIHVINKNGSGSFGKIYLTLKSFKNPYQMPANVLLYWIKSDLKGIVFCNTIRSLNGFIQYLSADSRFSNYIKHIKAYYSSLSNKLKQETLAQLKTGQVKIIVATNALEAGVDIPELDACLIIGYPGSKMSWKQRIGRVGRSKKGLVIFIPTTYSPLDKFYAQNMSSLLDGESESLSFNGDFPTILSSHLLCAANEIGIPENYQLLETMFGPQAKSIVNGLLVEGRLKSSSLAGKTLWVSNDYIHNTLSIRGGSGLNDVVNARIGSASGIQIEQMPKLQAISRLFPGAVFITHSSGSDMVDSYEVTELNLSAPGSNGLAILKKINMPRNSRITTTPFKTSSVEMVSVLQRKTIPLACGPVLQLAFGVAKYSTIVRGYEKRTYTQVTPNAYSHSLFDDAHLTSSYESQTVSLKSTFEVHYEAPALEFSFVDAASTRSALKPIFQEKIEQLRYRLQNSLVLSRKENEPKISGLVEMGELMVTLHTIVHQMLATVPSLLLTSRNDVEESMPENCRPDTVTNMGRTNKSLDLNNLLEHSGDRVYLVDSTEGGTGCCQDIFDNLTEIITKCIELPPCPSCTEEFENENLLSEDLGCVFCLHTNHCHKGLLKSMGISLFVSNHHNENLSTYNQQQ